MNHLRLSNLWASLVNLVGDFRRRIIIDLGIGVDLKEEVYLATFLSC